MVRSHKVALSGAALAGLLAIVACGSSTKTAATTTTTSASSSSTAAASGTTVNADLGDTKGLDAPETLKVTPVSAKAGDVTFVVKNSGTIEHEMIVLKTDTPFDQLEVGTDNKVSEDASVAEVSETDAGKTVTKTLDLTAGKYVLVCNIEKHYGQGMRSAFTVTA